MARAVFAALGREPRIEYIDMPESIRDKYQYFTQADVHKLLATGYDSPITSLEDAVRDYVVNYLVPGRAIGSSSTDFSLWPLHSRARIVRASQDHLETAQTEACATCRLPPLQRYWNSVSGAQRDGGLHLDRLSGGDLDAELLRDCGEE